MIVSPSPNCCTRQARARKRLLGSAANSVCVLKRFWRAGLPETSLIWRESVTFKLLSHAVYVVVIRAAAVAARSKVERVDARRRGISTGPPVVVAEMTVH